MHSACEKKDAVTEESHTPLGWTLVGPMGSSVGEDCHLNVNFGRSAEALREDDDCLMH